MERLEDPVRDDAGVMVADDDRAAPSTRTTREHLIAWARAHLQDRKLVVVSNREPYSHVRGEGGVRWMRNAGGLTVALDSVAQALGGLWVAHGSGNADKTSADPDGRVPCPPDRPTYTLKRVWLSREDQNLYYSGLSNSALWPLCHVVYVRPRFDTAEWERYREINRRFADAVLEEIGDQPAFVFIQDYHLALLAGFLRERRPDLEIALFWHIPWPNTEIFRIFPWKHELLEGLLANDLVGFHTRDHTRNFLDAVSTQLETRVDRERIAVERGGRRTWVRSFPIGVDAMHIARMAASPETRENVQNLRERFSLDGCKVGLGVDRMDYTKGIPERLDGIERMFEKYPQWIGQFCFIQIAVPSRIELREYRSVITQTRARVERINQRFPRRARAASRTDDRFDPRKSVYLLETNLDFRELIPYYRLADMCAVTSLHDGMNLVAKEYVSATDLDGSLVLSPFTGAASELERALLVSPYDADSLADTYHMALSEPRAQRRARMRALRETVLRHNIFDWAIEVFDVTQRLALRTPPDDQFDLG